MHRQQVRAGKTGVKVGQIRSRSRDVVGKGGGKSVMTSDRVLDFRSSPVFVF